MAPELKLLFMFGGCSNVHMTNTMFKVLCRVWMIYETNPELMQQFTAAAAVLWVLLI